MAQLVSAPPCHGGGRGFKSRQGRNSKHQFRLELVFLLLASGAPGVGVCGGTKSVFDSSVHPATCGADILLSINPSLPPGRHSLGCTETWDRMSVLNLKYLL